ncbi:response regulator [Microvirga massiliensis]|uniref:response regulator n=1 Tax=Microvirga massiliensis TaxID=1033741 RepID=UPI0006616C2E|nr:response regulator [Microvirga massiliensis]
MLAKSRVLVAEDEPLTALDIAATIRENGGEVLGPAAGVSEALDLVAGSQVDGAILDCKLRDGEITPVAEALLGRDVPVVLHTDRPMPLRLQGHANELPLFHKPTGSFVLARRPAQCILEEQTRRSVTMSPLQPSGRW